MPPSLSRFLVGSTGRFLTPAPLERLFRAAGLERVFVKPRFPFAGARRALSSLGTPSGPIQGVMNGPLQPCFFYLLLVVDPFYP